MTKYSKEVQKTVGKAMPEDEKRTLRSGSGRNVKSRKQAIALGCTEAPIQGARIPKKPTKKRTKKPLDT